MLGRIEDLNETLTAHDPLQRRVSIDLTTLVQERDVFGREALSRCDTAALAVNSPEDTHDPIAQPDRLIEHRVEDRSEVAG